LFCSTTRSAISRTKLNLFEPKSLRYWSRPKPERRIIPVSRHSFFI
jgi:hypothetical protein